MQSRLGWTSAALATGSYLLVAGLSCEARPPAAAPKLAAAPAAQARTLTLVATTDLHGHIEALPMLSSYAQRLRDLRRADGGMLLLDAGDMFQGTLESNQEEGRVVVEAYGALGYDAVTLGNHEFDFGPEGESAPGPGVDLFGALRARIREAKSPVLSLNLVETSSRRSPNWKGLTDAVLVDAGGVRVGLVGALTEETPKIVLPAYFQGLDVLPVAPLLARRAAALRAAGAQVVVALTHLGAECADFADPDDTSSCKPGSELESLAKALPRGSVDVIFGGHTHKAVAHRVNGIALAQAYSYGRSFSRVDVHVSKDGRPSTTILPPRDLCVGGAPGSCASARYEGAELYPDPRIARVIAPAQERAKQRRSKPVGVRLAALVGRAFDKPSPLGDLFADLLLQHATGAQVALMNGGGLRADLPAGELSYGQLFEAMPFDNRVARVRMKVGELREVLARHVSSGQHGILSVAGLRVVARCHAGALELALTDENGASLPLERELVVVTSDYLATGGDALFEGLDVTTRTSIDAQLFIRDAFAESLAKRKLVAENDVAMRAVGEPRLKLPSPRPVRCAP